MLLVMIFLSLIASATAMAIELEEAMKVGLEKNLRLQSMEREMGVFEGLKKSATAFPNPEITFESGFITTTRSASPKGRLLNLLELSQPLPLWGVRKKGREVIDLEEQAFSSELDTFRQELLGSIYRGFYESLYRKEVLRIWKEALRTADELKKFIERAYQLGETTQLEVLRISRERNLIEIKLRIAKAEYESSLRELSTLLNSDVRDVEGNLKDIKKDLSVEIGNLPQVISLKKRIKALDNRIELERALAKPVVRTGVIIEDSEAGYYGFRAVLSADIPAFYRRQGEILQSLSRKEAITKELEAVKLEIGNKLKAIKLRYEALLKEIERLDRELIPIAEEELNLALRSYRLRAITLLELSDVRNRYYELLLSRAELLRDLHRTYSEFIAIGGWR